MMLFVLIVGLGTSYGQEGDNPRSNKKKLRETRFKIKNKQGDKIHKGDITGRNKSKKVKRPKRKGKAVTPAPNPYAGRPEKTESKRYVSNPKYYDNPSKSNEKFRKGNISGNKLKYSKSAPNRGRPPVHAAPNPYAGRKTQSEKTRAKSNAPQLGSIRSVSGSINNGGKKKKRVTPRTASRPFIARKKVNVYALKSRNGERAFKGDITGRKVKKNRSSRKTRVIKPTFNPYYAKKIGGDRDKEYSGRKMIRNASVSKRGEQKYKGKAAGGHVSATKKGENAWRKDITGRDFKRPTDPGIVTGKKGVPLFNAYANKMKGKKKDFKGKISAGGYISATEKGERKSVAENPNLKRRLSKTAPTGNNAGKPILGKSTANPKISGFSGRLKGAKPIKGAGGSITKGGWNNKGQALARKDNLNSGISLSQGNIKGARKPLKGGGSIHRNNWNNKGQALTRKDNLNSGISLSQGNIKGARKPVKGGGSIHRNNWNNKGQALARKDNLNSGISLSQGNIKGARKPVKGGGSIHRNNWNNKGQALARKDELRNNVSSFQGNLKGYRKPLKGGGSISRSGWNNKGEALRKKDVTLQDLYVYNFQGRFKRFEISPGYLAEEASRYKGNLKDKKKYQHNPLAHEDALKSVAPGRKVANIDSYVPKYKKVRYSKRPNAHDNALLGIAPKGKLARIDSYVPKYSKVRYSKRPNAHDDALKGIAPKGKLARIDSYVPKYSKVRYSKRPNAHDDALKGIAPKGKLARIDNYVPKYAKVSYSKKPNAADGALKGVGPKNGASKAMAFQGNFKVKKTYEKGMHPSAKYTTSQKPLNSLDEKQKTFKFKIWWAKLFKKNENQPDAVTDKVRKPRYDPKEKDIWYE